MKNRFILLLLLMFGFSAGLFAQKTFVIAGNFDSPVSGHKVWVNYISYTSSLCEKRDSTLTNSSGYYELNYSIDSTCYYGDIYITSLNCAGDTLRSHTIFNYNTWTADTLWVNMKYCDTCGYIQANFVPTVTAQYVHFNNTTSYSTYNTYTWEFGDGSANANTGNTNHNYAALGTYNACLYVEDTTNGCRDTVCKDIHIVKKNRPDSIFIIGHVNTTVSTTAWVDFAGYPSGCNTGGTATVSAGMFNYSIPTAACYFGIITVEMLDCNGDTLTYTTQYDTTRASDTFNVYFNYCDSCRYFEADFNYAVSGDTVVFTDSSSSSANKFHWSFDYNNPSITSTAKNPVHIYGTSGVYSVALIAEDTLTGCVDSIRKWINIGGSGPSYRTLSGTVYLDSGVVADTFKVWLIRVEIDSAMNDTILTAIDSLAGPGGSYNFTTVNPGIYLVKAALHPASTNFANYLPTYYTASVQWSSATPVTVLGNVYGVDIDLINGSNPGGSGFIGGYVSVGANKTGDPIEDIEVQLYNATTGAPLAFAYTDDNGEYTFENLAFGTYKVRVEVLGKPSQYYTITLDATNATANNKSFAVNSTGVETISTSVGIAKVQQAALGVYPNPATSNVSISFVAATAGHAQISIFDLAGRELVSTTYTTQVGDNTATLNVEKLNTGVYIIRVSASGAGYVGRLSIYKQ